MTRNSFMYKGSLTKKLRRIQLSHYAASSTTPIEDSQCVKKVALMTPKSLTAFVGFTPLVFYSALASRTRNAKRDSFQWISICTYFYW